MTEPSKIAYVTLKETGELIDLRELDYSFKLDELMDRHDLSKVEVTVKLARYTKPAEAEEPKEVYVSPVDEDDDVPF